MGTGWLLPSAVFVLLPLLDALHCVSHEHCGEHAVCVTQDSDPIPKCMCLLGYKGNGAVCEESRPDLAEQSSSVIIGKTKTIVIEKCSVVEEARVASTQKPESTPQGNLVVAETKLKRRLGPATQETDSAPPLSLNGTFLLPCHAVECDFSNGPCSYQNDYYSEWQLREIEGGTILLATGESKTEHYLLSGTFEISQPSILVFDYFESSVSRSHLSIYSNDLATLIWKAEGPEAGWRQALTSLPPGRHQIIFAAEKLGSQELTAVTNVRLVKTDGAPAPCS